MKVEIGCPACGKKHDIDSNLVGQSLTCTCGNKFVAQLPPPKVVQATSAEVEPSPALPIAEQEVHINSRIRIWFWIGIVGLIVLFVIWWNSGRPMHPPTPPAAVSARSRIPASELYGTKPSSAWSDIRVSSAA